MKNIKRVGLRMEEELLRKFKYICEYNGRSLNGELVYMVKRYVEKFERLHGKIDD